MKRIEYIAALRIVFPALALLVLAACAAPEDEAGERFVVFPDEAATIDLAETDLTLPLESPLEISDVRKRVGEGQIFENIYRFHEVTGFLRTSRVVFGHFSENVSRSLRHQGYFEAFAGDLALAQSDGLKLGPVYRFAKSNSHTTGFYAFAGEDPYFDSCFVARVGYLLVDYASVKRQEDSVDTLVEVFLCGRLPKQSVLIDFLGSVKAVEDREAYRRRLSRNPVGTI